MLLTLRTWCIILLLIFFISVAPPKTNVNSQNKILNETPISSEIKTELIDADFYNNLRLMQETEAAIVQSKRKLCLWIKKPKNIYYDFSVYFSINWEIVIAENESSKQKINIWKSRRAHIVFFFI